MGKRRTWTMAGIDNRAPSVRAIGEPSDGLHIAGHGVARTIGDRKHLQRLAGSQGERFVRPALPQLPDRGLSLALTEALAVDAPEEPGERSRRPNAVRLPVDKQHGLGLCQRPIGTFHQGQEGFARIHGSIGPTSTDCKSLEVPTHWLVARVKDRVFVNGPIPAAKSGPLPASCFPDGSLPASFVNGPPLAAEFSPLGASCFPSIEPARPDRTRRPARGPSPRPPPF